MTLAAMLQTIASVAGAILAALLMIVGGTAAYNLGKDHQEPTMLGHDKVAAFLIAATCFALASTIVVVLVVLDQVPGL